MRVANVQNLPKNDQNRPKNIQKITVKFQLRTKTAELPLKSYCWSPNLLGTSYPAAEQFAPLVICTIYNIGLKFGTET